MYELAISHRPDGCSRSGHPELASAQPALATYLSRHRYTHYVAETTNTYGRFESFAPPSQRVIAIATIGYQHGSDTSVAHAQLKEHVS